MQLAYPMRLAELLRRSTILPTNKTTKKTPIKYQDNKNVTFKPLLSQRISVTEIYCDSDEQECEGPVQEIVLSSSGVELSAKAGIKHKILKTFNIKNAYLYKKGKTESGNPIRNAVMGGLIGAQGGDPFKGIVIGAISTPSPNDIWYIYIRARRFVMHISSSLQI